LYLDLKQPSSAACASRGRWGGWDRRGGEEMLELCTHDELCKIAVSPYDMIQDAKEALAKIDKAIGGKEDE